MRIDKLTIQNFRCFEEATFDFHPQFNLLVGENASGKTSVLDALSVAAGSWFLGIGGHDTRHIREEDVRKVFHENPFLRTLESQYPVSVEAEGVIPGLLLHNDPGTWSREIKNAGGKTRFKNATWIKKAAAEAESLVRRGQLIRLPLIAYYGAGRLWMSAKDMEGSEAHKHAPLPSRLDGYKTSIDPRISFPTLLRWLANEKYVALQKKAERNTFRAVKEAMRSCVEGCASLDYDVELKMLMVRMERGEALPYSLLSDGQRAMITLVADIAVKAALLNPQLNDAVLTETDGVVLIDELDLHLHPRWQRHVVADLKRTFPKIQFFASTHSPQVIGETPHNEIILLKNDRTWTRPEASIGLHSNEVLLEIMGATTVNREAEENFIAIAKLIDEGDFESAGALISQCRERLGTVPKLEASEVYMDRVDILAADDGDDGDDGKKEQTPQP